MWRNEIMKIFLLLAFLILSAFSLPAQSKSIPEDKSDPFSMRDQQNADRLLLVAFSDSTINSLKNTASPIAYRQRGDYQSSTWSERVSNQLADDYGMEKLTEWPMTEVGAHCVVYRLSDKATMADIIDRLSKDDRVDIAQRMNTFNTKAQYPNDPYLKLQTNLQQMQINLAHDRATGQNITIGMIDTGVDMAHPDLIGQISDNKNLAKDISNSFSTDKHGTAMAGVIVARKDNAKGIMGIAPNARLVALKACWPDKPDSIEAVCNSFTLALALNTAIKAGVDVLNMSLTGPKDPLLTLLLKKALEKGIIIVASDTGTGENFPASLNDVISVQSVNQTVLQAPSTSDSISAPGDKVLTTLPYGTYDFISGSSIAAAEISGVVALLLEIKPDLSVAQVHTILDKSKIASKEGLLSGINANVALSSLCESSPCPKEILSFAQVNPF
jgi:subtilisin family serine protease